MTQVKNYVPPLQNGHTAFEYPLNVGLFGVDSDSPSPNFAVERSDVRHTGVTPVEVPVREVRLSWTSSRFLQPNAWSNLINLRHFIFVSYYADSKLLSSTLTGKGQGAEVLHSVYDEFIQNVLVRIPERKRPLGRPRRRRQNMIGFIWLMIRTLCGMYWTFWDCSTSGFHKSVYYLEWLRNF